MSARLASSLAVACFALSALANPMDLRARSGDCFDANHEPCPTTFSTRKIIAIIVSCSVFVLLVVAFFIFRCLRKRNYEEVSSPPSYDPTESTYSSTTAGEMGYAGNQTHLQLYTPSSSTLSSHSHATKPASPPPAQAMYGFSVGAI